MILNKVVIFVDDLRGSQMHYHTPWMEPVNARNRPISHHHISQLLVPLAFTENIAELLQRRSR